MLKIHVTLAGLDHVLNDAKIPPVAQFANQNYQITEIKVIPWKRAEYLIRKIVCCFLRVISFGLLLRFEAVENLMKRNKEINVTAVLKMNEVRKIPMLQDRIYVNYKDVQVIENCLYILRGGTSCYVRSIHCDNHGVYVYPSEFGA